MNAAVSVIIPNLHSPVIGEVLGALLTQADALSKSLEVWVVGQDRYGQVQPDERVHMLTTAHPVPPPQARNLGAAAATGETLIFLDADCVPQPGWLAAMLDAEARWLDAGAISGAMLPEGDNFVVRCGQIAGFHEHLSLHRPGRRRILASFSLLIPRSVLEAMGGFTPELRMGEDIDLSVRLIKGGWSLYLEPRAKVFHRPQRSSWLALWRYALMGGGFSIRVRQWHRDQFEMPGWTVYPWAWWLLSPGIAIVRTAQIYACTPGLWRYWCCAPWVALSKLAWCWGAASGLRQQPIDSASGRSTAHEGST